MQFTTLILTQTPNYTLSKLTGNVVDSIPFEAFLFNVKKSSVVFEIHYANPPQKVSTMCTSNPLNIAALNGGFYKLALENRTPLDWLVIHSQKIQSLRNYSRPCIYLTKEEVYISSPSEDREFDSVLQAGPLLLNQGSICYDYSDFQENALDFDADITAERYPRSVFGYDSQFYYFLVIDGRLERSHGLYIEETALLAQKVGMLSAINLDGGGSSTLIVDQQLINEPRFASREDLHPLDAQVQGAERLIPTALLVHLK